MSGFVAGQAAALAGMLSGSAVATLSGGRSPLESVAAPLIASTPADLANAILHVLGPFAKPFAAWGAAALLLLAGGALGVALWRLPGWTRPTAPPVAGALAAGAGLSIVAGADRWGVAAAAVVYGLGIAWLARERLRSNPGSSGRNSGRARATRREWLARSARTVGVVAVASALPLAGATLRSTLGVRATGPLFAFTPPAARRPGFDVEGLSPEISPSFYYMSKNVTDPVLNAGLWQLEIDGLVERRLRLSLEDLLALPRVDRYVTQECVSNPVGGPLMSAGLFSGVLAEELFRTAGMRSEATFVHFESPDGHHEGIGLVEGFEAGMLVAYALNGEPLPWAHGYPARVLVPGFYGFRSVKWLTRAELTSGPRAGHWEQRGWTARQAHPTARIDLARVTETGLLVAGVAYGGRSRIGEVQIRIDGEPWQVADLHVPPLSDAMWVQWRALLSARPGARLVQARTIDGSGRPQDETERGQFPNGATGLHSVRLSV